MKKQIPSEPQTTRSQADAALRHSLTHRVFLVGVIIKGINGFLQTAGGIYVLSVSVSTITAIGDFISGIPVIGSSAAEFAGHVAQDMTKRQLFAAYLLAHGVIKLFLVVGLLRRWLWAYPTALLTSGMILVGELWRVSVHFSWGLIVLMVLDVVIAVFIWREYVRLRALRALPS